MYCLTYVLSFIFLIWFQWLTILEFLFVSLKDLPVLFFHYVFFFFFLLYGFSYCLYQVIYFKYSHLKFLSRSSIICSSQDVSLNLPLSLTLSCFVFFCASYFTGSFPFVQCTLLGTPSCPGMWSIPAVCSQVCFSPETGSDLTCMWTRFRFLHQVPTHHSRFEFSLHFWELGIHLSYFWEWLCIL